MSRAGAWGTGLLLGVVALAGLAAWALWTPSAPQPVLTGKLRAGALEVQGHRRTFRYYVPARPAPAAALVLALHGSRGTGAQLRRQTAYEFDVLADRHRFIVAYPDAYAGYWNDCRRGSDPPARRAGLDDVAFLRAMIAWLSREHGASADRVMAFGLSNGGHMGYRLALEAPAVAKAVTAVAASLPTPENQACTPTGRPAAVLIVNGTADPINPYEGGEVSFYRFFIRRGTVLSSLDSARYWAALAGHSGDPARQPMPDTDAADGARATLLSWSAAGREEVALISVEGGGHTLPQRVGGLPRILGRTCRDFSVAEEAWSFFQRQIAGAPGRP